MAHFAQLDITNTVINVIVISNEVLLDSNGVEQEQLGIEFCQSLYGADTIWKQTSYNGSFRKYFAGVGYTYDPARDIFVPRRPFISWVLNEDIFDWEAPVPYPNPDNGRRYAWDEVTRSWRDEGEKIATNIETL